MFTSRIVPVAAIVAALTAGLTVPALSADPAGQAVAVNPAANASGAGGARTLATNGAIYTGDVVTTDAAGEAQLKFRDDTRMVVGPNSELTIDRFVYVGPATAKQVTLNAGRGVFRFITGNSPKPAYLIDTPVATITVRGSHTDFILPGDGTMGIVYYTDPGEKGDHGLYVCDKPELRKDGDRRRRCVNMVNECAFVVFTAGEDPHWVMNAYDRTAMMDKIPFAFRQGGLAPGFHVNSGACNSRRFPGPSHANGSGGSPPGSRPPRFPGQGHDGGNIP